MHFEVEECIRSLVNSVTYDKVKCARTRRCKARAKLMHYLFDLQRCLFFFLRILNTFPEHTISEFTFEASVFEDYSIKLTHAFFHLFLPLRPPTPNKIKSSFHYHISNIYFWKLLFLNKDHPESIAT